MNSNIFIIVPAYNEEKHIGQTIKDLLEHDYTKIIVVDDCSSDKTFEIAKQFSIDVLRHKINRGQGAALQTGTDFAVKNGAEIIVHFDADGQFLASEIENLVAPIIFGEADIVLGSRFLSSPKSLKPLTTNIPFLKKNFILPVARVINYFFTGLKLSDAHCGLRAMNRLAAGKIRIAQDGMAHNTEIVAQIKKNNLRWREVPETVIYHEFGQGIGGGFKILKELLKKKIIK